MLNGFRSSRYLEEKFSNSTTRTISPPLSCFLFPCSLSIAVSYCSQWFVSSGGSSCSFCIVISLIVIIRASYLQLGILHPTKPYGQRGRNPRKHIGFFGIISLISVCSGVGIMDICTSQLHMDTLHCVYYSSHSYTPWSLASSKCNVPTVFPARSLWFMRAKAI